MCVTVCVIGILVNVIGACGSVEWVSFKRDFKRNRRTFSKEYTCIACEVKGTFYYNYRKADTKQERDNHKARKFCEKFNTKVIG